MEWLEAITGFDWDAGNIDKSAAKHHVAPAEAEQVFMNEPLLVVDDIRHSVNERRMHALGRTNGDRLLHITFTLRGGGSLIRVISARDADRKERKIYEKEK